MKPNLIVIGAMKAGTTSLHNYLNCHPDIAMSEPKETNFFSNPKFWKKGPGWYEAHFNTPAPIRGESSTAYTSYPLAQEVAGRMKVLVPDARLIYLVRDPVDRFVSHYAHSVGEGKEARSFGEVVAAACRGEPCQYASQSQYHLQLKRYLDHFPPEQLLVISSESLRSRREELLAEVCRFLGLVVDFSGGDITKEHNTTDKRTIQRNSWARFVYPGWMASHPRLPWIAKAPFYRLARLGAPYIERPVPTEQEMSSLVELFRPEVHRLTEFLGHSNLGWREYS